MPAVLLQGGNDESSVIRAGEYTHADIVLSAAGRLLLLSCPMNQCLTVEEELYIAGPVATYSRNRITAFSAQINPGLDLSGSLQGAGGIGGLLASYSTSTSRPAYFAVADGNGNITDLVSTNGTSLAHYEYDPYGNTIVKSGVMSDANPFRFSSKYYDSETGLYYYGYRYLDTVTGRWVSRDPLEESGGVALYAYCDNGSINIVDFLGLWKRSSGHNWIAERGDSLRKLAKMVEYGENADNYSCLWPVDPTKNHGYPDRIWPCDVYDASNLAADTKGVKLNLSVSADTTGLGGTVVSAATVPKVIQDTSNEGGTPIGEFFLQGHSGAGNMGGTYSPSWTPPEGGVYFNGALYNQLSNPGVTFDRAKQKKGPKRCWFTRQAEVRFGGCHTHYLASDFAAIALRKGATAYGTLYFSGISLTGIRVQRRALSGSPMTGYSWTPGLWVESDDWRDSRFWNGFSGGLGH